MRLAELLRNVRRIFVVFTLIVYIYLIECLRFRYLDLYKKLVEDGVRRNPIFCLYSLL